MTNKQVENYSFIYGELSNPLSEELIWKTLDNLNKLKRNVSSINTNNESYKKMNEINLSNLEKCISKGKEIFSSIRNKSSLIKEFFKLVSETILIFEDEADL